jgi:hypothetical protein
LRWVLTNFLPRLALNCDLSDLYVLNNFFLNRLFVGGPG